MKRPRKGQKVTVHVCRHKWKAYGDMMECLYASGSASCLEYGCFTSKRPDDCTGEDKITLRVESVEKVKP